MNIKLGQVVRIALGLIVTGACLLVALWGVDFDEVATSFSRASYYWIPLFLLALFGFYWFKAVRWKILLTPLKDFETRQVFGPMMIGFMANNLLPAHLGEFLRALVLGQKYEVSKVSILSSIVLERVLDVIFILGLFALGLVSLRQTPSSLTAMIPYLATFTVLIILFLGSYLIWSHLFIAVAEWVLRRFSFIPVSLGDSVVGMMRSGAEGLDSLRSPRLILWLALTSLAQWLLMTAMAQFSLWALGIQISLFVSMIVIGVTALGVTVPSSPGYFGVIQLCYWISLRPFGVDKVEAFSASVYFHMAQYIPVTLAGLYFLSRMGIRLADLMGKATSEPKPAK